jgi:hypothetical protein
VALPIGLGYFQVKCETFFVTVAHDKRRFVNALDDIHAAGGDAAAKSISSNRAFNLDDFRAEVSEKPGADRSLLELGEV